ncbi:TPA: copper-translocating P-type ATPase [Mannheimia haemolytica]|uniref:Copper-exporting P-type ATPase n=3 Tax=Mannheimia haemolytica TaxID=75985 RepID=Q06Q13_MANHA|nr:copper-translocating P-type ATPase [Mannheimia haemolytica]AWW71026.1 copper-translocating P-type ATPase [Pasteurellaceae bacterium 12565]ABG89154.1 cation transport ATPase [Mannheimia haemolytica]AGI32135.1 copper-translocating P-type ATPase [Mannheimia haemolytica USDA-ARS-USMARC-183]AGI35752.1 copper-translocating P-type ATPase [Mannheimia haemolytica USDA-ARS-USMARC-185]AGQ25124.1 copper exporting ATPase [Mannheimia haemolytica D153]
MTSTAHYSPEQQLLIDGMHCAACVRRVEKALLKVEKVEFASVNLADQTAFVQGNANPEALVAAVVKIGFGAEVLESEEERRIKQQAQTQRVLGHKRTQFMLALVVGFALVAFGFYKGMTVNETNRSLWLSWAGISLATMYFSGKDFFLGAFSALKNRSANMDMLVAISTGTAWLYSCWLTLFPQPNAHVYFEASVMILGFINLGKYLELKAKQRSSLALEKLLDLAPKQAVIFEENIAKTIPAKAIKPQMRVQALTGDRLAVDGILDSGSIWVDESMLTGEALPVEKKIGDKVRAGTLVQDGSGTYIAEQVGSQTALARVINAVRHAQSSKPPLAQFVDKIAAVFVPVVVSIALLSALIWLAVGQDFAFALSIFTTVLIIACPCALGLAIPLSTIAGVARSAEFGVLVRNIEALQASSEIDTLVFDKTGTLTTGRMEVSDVLTFNGFEQKRLLQLAKSVEQHASHPIAKAIAKFAENQTACGVTDVQVLKGLGISAKYEGSTIRMGNWQFVGETIQANLASLLPAKEGDFSSKIFVSVDNQLAGVLSVSDQLRPEAKATIHQFQAEGYQCVMLTGDRQQTADYFANALGLDGVIAEVLPEQKAEKIRALQAEGKKVAMIGDGINDAPALAQANVGIAMHNGSDIAVETADLSLMREGLAPLMQILPFSKKVLKNMKQSLLGAFIYNVIAIPIAAGVLYPFTGWLLNPMIAAIAMTLSSITVVLNSQRLLK